MAYSPLHDTPTASPYSHDTAPPSYDEVFKVQDQHEPQETAHNSLVLQKDRTGQDRHEPQETAHNSLVLRKDRTGRVGLSVVAVNGSILINHVAPSSPAELAGLKFGDQIISVNGDVVMGFSADLTCRLIKSSQAVVTLQVKERPFAQTYLLEKGLDNKVGVHLTGNKVVKVEHGSSAAQCGMRPDQCIIEVNGQSVAGQEAKTVKLISQGPPSFFVTVIPKYLYKQMSPP